MHRNFVSIAAVTSTDTALVAKKLCVRREFPQSANQSNMTKSTLTTTKSSRNNAALIEGNEGIETAAILASATPLGIVPMATFPLSLIALGQIRREQFDDTLTLRPKRNSN